MKANEPLFIEKRIIMTPGPVEADPRVLSAMTNPIVHQFDPVFTNLMDEVKEMIRRIFKTNAEQAFAINGSARAGIEALLTAIIQKGTRVYIPIAGRFGHLLAEIAKRAGANVHTSEVALGQVHSFDTLKREMEYFKPHVVAIVHGESSTGTKQPLKELGAYCIKTGALFMVDGVATVLGEPFEMDAWNIDAAVTGSQKCLAAPAGMSLVAYNDKIKGIVDKRKKVDQGLDPSSDNPKFIASNYLDLSQLQAYWSSERLNHHTEATSMLYAIHEALRLVMLEGVDERVERHAKNMQALKRGLKSLGLEFFEDQNAGLNTITCVKVPREINAAVLKEDLIRYFNIEIAPGFGPLKDSVIRIGAMGHSSRKPNILTFLSALESLLGTYGKSIGSGTSLKAALDGYANR
jgi:(S)-ureidoglycine-glyoxylate aminotransferase